jgi:hypothetical protein
MITPIRRTTRRVDIIARPAAIVNDWRFASVAFVPARVARLRVQACGRCCGVCLGHVRFTLGVGGFGKRTG